MGFRTSRTFGLMELRLELGDAWSLESNASLCVVSPACRVLWLAGFWVQGFSCSWGFGSVGDFGPKPTGGTEKGTIILTTTHVKPNLKILHPKL